MSRRFGRTALIAAAAAAIMGGALAAAPLAHADGGLGSDYYLAFEASNNNLANFNLGIPGSTTLGMEPGTHPSISALSSNGYQITFAANTDVLWTWGPLHDGSLGQLMATGTSPSMTILSNGSYEIAFQGANHDLWLYNQNNGAQDTGLGMDPASSPSITSEPNTGYEVAFEANTNNLWLVGSDNRGDTGLGMRAGSSPSITLPTGSGLRYQAAFVANTGILWTVGTFQNGSTGAAVASGSNPAITTLTQSGGFQIAYVAALAGGGAGGILETTGTDGLFNTETPVAPDTSPSITGMFIDGSCGDGSTGYRVAFDSGSAVIDPGGGKLVTESFGDGVGIATNSGQLMSPGSSPSITASNDHC